MLNSSSKSRPPQHRLGTFIEGAIGDAMTAWSHENLESISQLQVPEVLLGPRQGILRADIHIIWARWFVEALGDPLRFHDDVPYAEIYKATLDRVRKLNFDGIKKSELEHIASKVASALLAAIQGRAEARRRSLNLDTRNKLLELAGRPPRCWICGQSFRKQAIDAFLREGTSRIHLPQFIDYLKPSGLKLRDYAIEADHVIAFASGGKDGNNLRLACGWCNRHKSNMTSIYDLAFEPRLLKRKKLGSISVPQPFWVVRLLAIRRVCEINPNCQASADNSEMTICLREEEGAANPCNLMVCCHEHDPMGKARYVDRRLFTNRKKPFRS